MLFAVAWHYFIECYSNVGCLAIIPWSFLVELVLTVSGCTSFIRARFSRLSHADYHHFPHTDVSPYRVAMTVSDSSIFPASMHGASTHVYYRSGDDQLCLLTCYLQ
jgi:hypothetical protein